MKDVSVILYSAPDVAKAKQFFREFIGADPYADAPQYVGYKSGNTEIGLVPNGNNGEPGAVAYWDVDDIAAKLQGPRQRRRHGRAGCQGRRVRNVGRQRERARRFDRRPATTPQGLKESS